MAYYLNLATLFLHGGYPQVKKARLQSGLYFSRLLVAKRLLTAVGIITLTTTRRHDSEIIQRLEKKFRFLEKHGALKISAGIIYYDAKNVSLGQEGNGVIDIVKTMTNAIIDSVENRPDVWRPRLAASLRGQADVFFSRVADLTELRPVATSKLRRAFLNPLLNQEALDLSAARLLHDLNNRGAIDARVKTIKRHPQLMDRVLLLMKEMHRSRRYSSRFLEPTFVPGTKFYHSAAPSFPIGEDFRLDYKGGPQLALVISDQHLTSWPHERQDDLLRFYDLARGLRAPVVHNGDYYDLFAYQSNLVGAWQANKRVFQAADSVAGVVQIPGNHDQWIKQEDNAKLIRDNRPNVALLAKGKYFDGRVYIEHGHQADRHNQEGQKRGYYIVQALSWLEQTIIVRKYFQNLVRWLELLERGWFTIKHWVTGRDEWGAYKRDATIQRVREVFVQSAVEREKMGLPPFSQEDPLIYIRGHDHGAGIFFTIDEIINAVYHDQFLAGRARYFSSGSWKGDEADLLAVDYSQPDRVYVYPFVWKPSYNRFVAFTPKVQPRPK